MGHILSGIGIAELLLIAGLLVVLVFTKRRTPPVDPLRARSALRWQIRSTALLFAILIGMGVYFWIVDGRWRPLSYSATFGVMAMARCLHDYRKLKAAENGSPTSLS